MPTIEEFMSGLLWTIGFVLFSWLIIPVALIAIFAAQFQSK